MSKRLAAKSMGCGRTFYADEPEDLAYLKQLAKETRGDENKWPELNLKIYGRPSLSCGKCRKTPEEHYKDKHGELWCVGNVNERFEPMGERNKHGHDADFEAGMAGVSQRQGII